MKYAHTSAVLLFIVMLSTPVVTLSAFTFIKVVHWYQEHCMISQVP